jgi:hypothetical protein
MISFAVFKLATGLKMTLYKTVNEGSNRRTVKLRRFRYICNDNPYLLVDDSSMSLKQRQRNE